MATTLIIARHGTTFELGGPTLRQGSKTDLPLIETGIEQGLMLGECLKKEGLIPDKVYSSSLKRAKVTAQKALEAMGIDMPIEINDEVFMEFEYGIDEGKPEPEVVARLGKEAIDLWNKQSIVPDGWNIDVDAAKEAWVDFGNSIKDSNQKIFVATSSGIAKFALEMVSDKASLEGVKLKMLTGAYSILKYDNGAWTLQAWGINPKEVLEKTNNQQTLNANNDLSR